MYPVFVAAILIVRRAANFFVFDKWAAPFCRNAELGSIIKFCTLIFQQYLALLVDKAVGAFKDCLAEDNLLYGGTTVGIGFYDISTAQCDTLGVGWCGEVGAVGKE